MAIPKGKSELEKAQLKATIKLEKERKAWAKKHGGVWPTDAQIMRSRRTKP